MSPAAINATGGRGLTGNVLEDKQHANSNLSVIHSNPTHSILSNPNANSSGSGASGKLNDTVKSFVAGGSNRTIATTITHNNSTSDQYSNEWFELPKMDNFVDVFSICCSTAVIFGGLIPYIPQYLKIKRSMNSDGFSTYGMLLMMEICIRVRDKDSSYIISAIGGGGSYNRGRRSLMGKLSDNELISPVNACNDLSDSESRPIYSVLGGSPSNSSLSSVARLAAISGADGPSTSALYSTQQAPSSTSTSYQSEHPLDSSDEIITTHVVNGSGSFSSSSPILNYNSLTQQCQARNSFSSNDRAKNSRKLECCNLNDFWDWDDYISYAKFLSLFTLIMGLITYLLIDNYLYVESIGFLAVMTESMLGAPQLLKNFAKKSTRGMSVEMVVMWLSGDLFKTLYFILRKAPIQFYICGSIQVLVDVLILGQVFWYSRPTVTYRKLAKSTR